MKNRMQHFLASVLMFACFSAQVAADGLLMARTDKSFPEAMTVLQSAISSRGYTITRLQQVNENLERRDYKSDMYRVVYFGKYEEVKQLTAAHPELIAFLPLSITIFAEGDQSIMVASHPQTISKFYPDAALKPVFDRWENDIEAIMDEVRE